jgi:hypothetical protein
MGRKVRVFVSSTMEDLANERVAVVKAIKDFNFEPVNAENWLPNGTNSWNKIKQEIEFSHIFILLVGDRYGWITKDESDCGRQRSVTHMELDKARETGIPVLPFLKKLSYSTPNNTPDAQKRDAFRKKICDWNGGYFVSFFDLAFDLADKVSASLVEVLSESYLNSEVRRRAQQPVTTAADPEVIAGFSSLEIPPELVKKVVSKEIVLFAGAGISLAAGYPSAHALSAFLISRMLRDSSYETSQFTGSFQEIAEIFEAMHGRRKLEQAIIQAMSAPQGIIPTQSHHLGVKLFNKIITTNYDTLFESACKLEGLEYYPIDEDKKIPPSLNNRFIIKLHGSLSKSENLLITENDEWNHRLNRQKLWDVVTGLVQNNSTLFVGSSLRDVRIKRLLSDGGGTFPRYVVTPVITELDKLRFAALNLIPIKADVEIFFDGLYGQLKNEEENVS